MFFAGVNIWPIYFTLLRKYKLLLQKEHKDPIRSICLLTKNLLTGLLRLWRLS